MRGRDEGTLTTRSGEHDVARLVADLQGSLDVRPRSDPDHADTIGQMVDHPDLVVIAGRDRDRLEADRDRGLVLEAVFGDRIDLESVVGGVDGEQALAVG